MAKCYIEMEGSPPELLYEDVRDGRGNFIETTYHNRTCVKNIWGTDGKEYCPNR